MVGPMRANPLVNSRPHSRARRIDASLGLPRLRPLCFRLSLLWRPSHLRSFVVAAAGRYSAVRQLRTGLTKLYTRPFPVLEIVCSGRGSHP
jgi:hypothetical protein